MKSLFGFFFFAIISLALPAQAGFMIEPYVGYEMGTITHKNDPDMETKGTYYGGRLGYDFVGLKFGLDYQTGTENVEQGTSSASDGYSFTDMGVFAGFEFPFLLQVYVSYFFDSTAKFKGSINPKEFAGNGTRVGIGWTGLPFVSINLEYATRTYDEYDGSSLTDNVAGKFTGLSLSIPLP